MTLQEKIKSVLDLLAEIQEKEAKIRDAQRDFKEDGSRTRKSDFNYNTTRNTADEMRKNTIKEKNLDLTGLHLISSGTTSNYCDYREIHAKSDIGYRDSVALYEFEHDRFVFKRVDEIFSFSRSD